MKRERLVLVIVWGCLFAAASAKAQGAADKPAAPEMDPKMAEAMQKASTPGEAHKKLMAHAGSWDASIKMWMDPKAPVMEAAGKAEFKPIMGDRYLQQEFTGNLMGQPFSGWGILGFNTILKRYESVWIDNMSTGMYRGEGTADKSGAIVIKTTGADPMTGKVTRGRDVWKIEEKKMVLEMYMPAKGGKEFKTMEITYTKN
jgi:hypothetical protein